MIKVKKKKARPDFVDSPYFVDEVDNWHLLPSAPDEVREEFEKWMKAKELIKEEPKK